MLRAAWVGACRYPRHLVSGTKQDPGSGASRAVRRVYLGGAVRLVLFGPFVKGEAPAMLRDTAFDVAGRLRIVPYLGLTTRGSPDVKVAGQKRHCRHRRRLLLEEGPVLLT